MRFLSLTNRNMKEVFRDPLSILLGVALPVGFLILFTSIAKNVPLDLFTAKMLTPAIAVFGFAFLMMFSATLLTKDRQSAFLTRLLTTPLTSTDFILAYILPFLPLALLQIGVCFAVGSLLGYVFNWSSILALVVLIPTAVTCVGIGMVMGSLFTENQVAGIGSVLITVTSVFSGVWMDLNMVGGVFKRVGYILPFSHAVDAARAITNGAALGDVSRDLYWVFGYSVVFFVLGVICFSWRTKR